MVTWNELEKTEGNTSGSPNLCLELATTYSANRDYHVLDS